MVNEKAILIAGGAISVLLDVILSPNLPFFSNTPNFMIAYSVSIGLLSRDNSVFGIAFVLGLISDLLGYGPVGLLSIILIAAVAVERNYLSGLFRARSFSEIACFLCIILGVELLHAFGTVLLMEGIDPIDAVVYIALPCSVLDCVLGMLIYLLMGRILLNRPLQPERKPSKPRRL
ncbi:MAG: hypothetical protein ACI4B9_05250 [Eggerthellaceae bacterium]